MLQQKQKPLIWSNNMIWTDEVVEELRKMWDRGMTTGQIAKALNVTKNSIIGKVHRLCLTARPSPIKKASAKTEKKPATESKKVATTLSKSSMETVADVAPVVEKTENYVEETNIPLVKLDNHTCRWPLGDPRDDDFCFCGKRIKTGQTYCEEHAAIAYVRNAKKG
jgi:GcrA cell cycle regulator